jgi:hypothetical protein
MPVAVDSGKYNEEVGHPSFAHPRLISQSCHSNKFDSCVRLHDSLKVQEAASVALQRTCAGGP